MADSGAFAGNLDQPQYDRLVRYCGKIARNVEVAEDLASETLLEAWRHAHKLTDGDGIDRWLAAIARHVCLRWRREQGRAPHMLQFEDEHDVAADDDLDAACGADELGPELHHALGGLSRDMRAAFLLRHLADASQAEIAATIGTTEAAVSMRLSRARAQLRRTLEAGSDPSIAGWQDTRLWCSRCGTRRQQIRFDTARDLVSFRCPGCDDDPRFVASEFPLANPSIARMIGGLHQPAAISRRVEAWVNSYFRPALDGTTAGCTACGAPAKVVRTMPAAPAAVVRSTLGLYVHCDTCGTMCSTSLASLVLALPEVSVFSREQGRIRTLPLRHVEVAEQPAVQVTLESVSGLTRLDVLSRRDTFAVLGIHRTSQVAAG
jgi:RNA polymerase sigma-70 factor (ECF subfamily)